MNREAWIVFGCLVFTAVVGLVGYNIWEKEKRVRELQAQLAASEAASEVQAGRLAEAWREVEEARERGSALAQEVETARQRAETLAREMDAATDSQKRMEAEMRTAVESRDIAISELQGQLTVSILDRILFDSGDATLKPEGMEVLKEVAKVLARYTNRPVQVFGHTDNVPIRLRFASNWELSTARAVAAVRYLTEHAGVNPARLSAVGCGEFQPIADNSTAAGRAKNRRIALVVLPELFTPTDVEAVTSVNAVASVGSTNAVGSAESPEAVETPATPVPAPADSVNQNPVDPEPDPGDGDGDGDGTGATNAAPSETTEAPVPPGVLLEGGVELGPTELRP